MSIAVSALDESGVPEDLLVDVTNQWCTKGFRPALECPSCARPSRVLRSVGGRFGCTQCTPRRLPAQLRKNTRDWQRGGGSQFDQLMREIFRKDDSPEHQARLRVIKNRADALMRESLDELGRVLEKSGMSRPPNR